MNKSELRILVTGDRHWDNRQVIERALEETVQDAHPHGKVIVIEGCAHGADYLAGVVANAMGFRVDPYPADWDHFGRHAGPIRNELMLAEGKPDIVLAFHSNLAASRGTRHMLTIALEAGIPCWLYTGTQAKEIRSITEGIELCEQKGR